MKKEKEIQIKELEDEVNKLKYELRDCKHSFHAKFTALILAANTHDAVSSDWVKEAIDHLLKDDADWWGHAVKGSFKEKGEDVLKEIGV